MPGRTPADARRLDDERKRLRAKLDVAINEEDDPLAVYDQFIQWTIQSYGEKDPNSGLRHLLEEATRKFKDDPIYKTDLRYLKLWAMYATLHERPGAIAIYGHLLATGIGTSFSLLYEKYAVLLEADGKLEDADVLYRQGIRLQARPVERLKTRYRDFLSRSGFSSKPTATSKTSIGSSSTASKSQVSQPKTQNRSASSSSSTSKRNPASRIVNFNSTAESRYAAMLTPPDPGKRAEKMRFNMSLLFTKEGGEFSIQEARARSLGLLGKKWGPPPASESYRFPGTSSLSMPVDFNDDGMKQGMGGRRKSYLGGGEPTVTINTREALEDVFGMYNSPDRTVKVQPGSKYAPVRDIQPLTPAIAPRGNSLQNTKTPTAAVRPFVDENSQSSKTPSAKFAPFVDENAQSGRTPSVKFTPFVDENAQSGRTPSVKFTPFVDENAQSGRTPSVKFVPFMDENAQSGRTPSVKFTPFIDENKSSFTTPRPVLSLKESAAPSEVKDNGPRNPLGANANSENVFSSKVFTPAQTKLAPLRDVFTDDHGKPQPKVKPAHERAKSQHDADPARAFSPFTDENAKTPFKVFSRPPEGSENAFTPKTPGIAFTPFADPKPAFTPFKDTPAVTFTPFVDVSEPTPAPDPAPIPAPASEAPTQRRRSGGIVVVEADDSFDDDHNEFQDDSLDSQFDDDDLEAGQQHEQYDAPLTSDQVPEYEEGDSYQDIPLGGRFGRFNVMTPITERTFEYTTNSVRGTETPTGHRSGRALGCQNAFVPHRDEQGAIVAAERLAAELQEDESELEYVEEEPLEPLQLSVHLPPKESPGVALIEEKTGTLSLGESLTLGAKFKPPNPCNPFDPPIIATLLSRIPSDAHFYDLRDRESNNLDGLQKFAKKAGKNPDPSASFFVELNGHRFSISEKLGEGGFGAVFKARDMGARGDDEDSEEDLDDDDDDEGASMVALKVVKPRNLWEYHVLRRLHSVLPASLRRSVVLPRALYVFRDESFLVMDLCPQGTLLNIVNNAVAAGVSQQGGSLDELLVMFFTIELLRLLQVTHKTGFIHGDLKIDNCLLRLEDVPGGGSAWSSMYQPSGDGGWSYKGLKVIDFGRTIDTRLFPAGQCFIAEWPTDDRDCFEAREDRPWTFQTDYFGLAGIIYCMLFGKYIHASAVSAVGDRHKIATTMKRYWQTELWNRLFDILLNPCLVRPDGQLPVSDELGAVREEMEAWLQANCNRTSNTLKGLLKKVEVSCYVH